MRLALIALPALLVLPAPVRGDGVQATTPAKTEKKDKPAKPGKVYTDEDLKKAGKDAKDGKGGAVTFLGEPQGQSGADSSAHGSSEGGHQAASETSTSSETGDRQAASETGAVGGAGELGWRARAREYRQAIRNVQGEIDKVEARLGELRSPQQQPQPIEALQPDPQRRLTRSEERIELDKQLEELRKALADAQKALDDFLEEARRANVPPGWIEER